MIKYTSKKCLECIKKNTKQTSTQAHETDERNVNKCLRLKVSTIQKEKQHIVKLSIYKKQLYANWYICILKTKFKKSGNHSLSMNRIL